MRYPCPCCGHLVFDAPPGSYAICPVCFWEDDLAQLRFPDMGWGPNHVPLVESQRNFAEFGAVERQLVPHVRPALPDEPIDVGWRPIDRHLDNFENLELIARASPTSDLGRTYPRDSTVLYYWRPTFWRSSSRTS
jgi:hypothetical protein